MSGEGYEEWWRMRRDRKGLRQCEREQKKTQTFFYCKSIRMQHTVEILAPREMGGGNVEVKKSYVQRDAFFVEGVREKGKKWEKII